MVSMLVLIYFGRTPIANVMKTDCITFQTVNPELNFDFL